MTQDMEIIKLLVFDEGTHHLSSWNKMQLDNDELYKVYSSR